SAAIIFGAFLKTFANLKHGNAKSPISLFGGTSISDVISSKVNSSICSFKHVATATLKSCIILLLSYYYYFMVNQILSFFKYLTLFILYIYIMYSHYILFTNNFYSILSK